MIAQTQPTPRTNQPNNNLTAIAWLSNPVLLAIVTIVLTNMCTYWLTRSRDHNKEFKETKKLNERLIVENRILQVLQQVATKDDIANMATKDDIANMATKDDIARLESNMATKKDLKEGLDNVNKG
ncbi:hypothetical protein HC766_02320 [Candidatus Gracilibacteria bacterium]|nr:hypothetical protein [Candidatus Gracilibacteria bacterium]